MSTDTKAAPAVDLGNHLHSPPESSGSHKHEGSDSELSDIEDPEDDIGEIVPDHYADDGRVPVFKPTVDQFKSFSRYASRPPSDQLKPWKLIGMNADEEDKPIWNEIWHC